ncbi:hypothetical protein [Puniceibacterium confluentis]|nr:hypothetical protein [Puniceibacterium confluentis]
MDRIPAIILERVAVSTVSVIGSPSTFRPILEQVALKIKEGYGIAWKLA